MTNTTQRQFRKGDVVRCITANFTPEQMAIMSNRPLLNHLYIVRASLPSTSGSSTHTEVILLEEVHNKTYRTIYNGREYLVENGFNPIRFELVIPFEETDWAVGITLYTLSHH